MHLNMGNGPARTQTSVCGTPGALEGLTAHERQVEEEEAHFCKGES